MYSVQHCCFSLHGTPSDPLVDHRNHNKTSHSDVLMADSTASNESATWTNTSHNNTCLLPYTVYPSFMLIAYSTICIAGAILNCLAFTVYFCHIPSSNSVIVYLKNLVVADLLLVLSLPIRIIELNVTFSVAFRKFYCSFIASIFYLNMYSSILFLGYIAGNRYLKIVKPLNTYSIQRLRSAKILSVGTWCTLFALGMSYVFLKGEKEVKTNLKTACLEFRGGFGVYWHITLHTSGTILFLFVLIALCFFYFQTLKRLEKSPSSSSSKKQVKAKNNILVLLVVFLICFVPYHIVRIPYILSQINVISNCYWRMMLLNFKEPTIVLATLNSCLDPVIYFLSCKAFRSKLGLDKNESDSDPPEDRSSRANVSQTVLDSSDHSHINNANDCSINLEKLN
ncbi:P2Y purinoceptor 14-like [Amblyraja radiata]|uniref:P2Y purinoceptor 14-like n=1 Tax=Amblyraja radiata TaxID=386614 RepID=UPI001401C50F|nr:P2Y purinoceptor 14-like [Amblyraja radiata]